MIEIYHKRLYIEGQMSSRKQIGIMVLLTVMILAGGAAGWWMRTHNTSPEAVAGTSILKKDVVIVVNKDGEKIEKTPVNVIGKTALEVTRMAVDGQMETEGTGGGTFVTALAGRKADTAKREFWEMMVNSQPAIVGAGSYILQPGDVIEWKINTY